MRKQTMIATIATLLWLCLFGCTMSSCRVHKSLQRSKADSSYTETRHNDITTTTVKHVDTVVEIPEKVYTIESEPDYKADSSTIGYYFEDDDVFVKLKVKKGSNKLAGTVKTKTKDIPIQIKEKTVTVDRSEAEVQKDTHVKSFTKDKVVKGVSVGMVIVSIVVLLIIIVIVAVVIKIRKTKILS